MRKDLIINWLEKNGQTLTDTQLCHMEIYQNMVLSAPMNLTAIKDDEGFAIKHFIDSLTLLPWIDTLTNNAKVIDIGTGAGFPGVPLKIARPNLDITLLDSLQKRVLFLRKALDELGYADVETVHAKVEDYVRNVGEMYDIAVARAVARLEKLAGYALPLVKPGGLFLAMKGPNIEEEIKNAKPVLHKLGGEIINISAVEISQEMFHTIIAIQKK